MLIKLLLEHLLGIFYYNMMPFKLKNVDATYCTSKWRIMWMVWW